MQPRALAPRIVKSLNGQFELLEGKEFMEAILHAEGKAIDAVYAHNEDMALGAMQAIDASNAAAKKLNRSY